jgi:hypothetical protein
MVAALLFAATGAEAGYSIPVFGGPDGITQLGNIEVNAFGHGIEANFQSIIGDPPSLKAAAKANGEDHFNWFQVVTADNNPPNGPNGTPLSPPYVDPPIGGFGPPDRVWGDNQPWYFHEYEPPGPPFPPGYESDLLLSANTRGDTLDYFDYPFGPVGTSVTYATWLVSLYADGSVHSYHWGFSWRWSNSPQDPQGSVTLLEALPGEMAWVYHNSLVVPEPTTLLIWSLLSTLGLSLGWRRRKR